MKASKILNLLMLITLFAFVFTSCKKDNSSSSSSTATSSQTATIQNAESQDAVSSQVENTADNQADALEASNFSTAATKDGTINGVTITITGGYDATIANANGGIDTLTFPKTFTFNFNTHDTVNGEYMSQTGQITLVVDTIPVTGKKLWWRKHVSRVFTFTNFTVSTDSSSYTINGTRTMKRNSWVTTLSQTKLGMRLNIMDSIYSDLNIGITDGSYTGSFTRNVKRDRNSIAHFVRTSTTSKAWIPIITSDTLIINGNVTGTNLQDSIYSRDITSPLTYSVCPDRPYNIILTGDITDTEGTSGTLKASIIYTATGCTNKVTATNGNGKTIKISRKIDRTFKKI